MDQFLLCRSLHLPSSAVSILHTLRVSLVSDDSKTFLFALFFFFSTRHVFSSPAQPAGLPEILKKSLHSCSVRGGEEVFIIGKNFLKGTKVIFQANIAGVVPRLAESVFLLRCI